MSTVMTMAHKYVESAEALHHLHRAGFVVAPEMIPAHHDEAIRLNTLVDRMDDAYAHWMSIERHGVNTRDSERGALHELIKVGREIDDRWVSPLYAAAWARQRYRNRRDWAHAEAVELDEARTEQLRAEYEATPQVDLAGLGDILAGLDSTHYCRDCGEHFSDPHAIGCPMDPESCGISDDHILFCAQRVIDTSPTDVTDAGLLVWAEAVRERRSGSVLTTYPNN